MTVHNAYVIYKNSIPVQSRAVKHLDFQKEVIKEIIKEVGNDFVLEKKNKNESNDGHWPIEVSLSKRRACYQHNINGERKLTRVYCEKCMKYLCIYPCFKYHHINEEISVSGSENEIGLLDDQ